MTSTTLTLDKAGRVVLPKRIREKMHLREGSRLRLELVNDKIELSQEPVEAKIVKDKDGFPVIMGWEGYDAAKAVTEARQEQLDRLDGETLNDVADSIDTTVLVAAMVAAEDFHSVCRPLAVGGQMRMFSHGIAETFSTLTSGRQNFRLSADTVSALLGDHFVPQLEITVLTPTEMLHAMRECESRGVRGGAIFDYLHLVAARKAKTERLYTLNVSNFRAFHRTGDPEIVHP